MGKIHNDLQHANKLTSNTLKFLISSAKWANFLGIVTYCLCGLMFLFAFILLIIPSDPIINEQRGLVFIYIFGGIFYIYLGVLLTKFAKGIKVALDLDSNEEMDDAFNALKSIFKFFGWTTIIYLAFFALALIMAVVVSIFS